MSDDVLVERSPNDDGAAPERSASFRELFAIREYRALYLATGLSFIGDYMAKAAITVMIYQQTSSVALSAAAFAISYLPWIMGGPVLATLAERFPYRRVMIICDVVRMVLIGAVAIPGLPVPAMLGLLFAAMLANPPTQAARSALMPLILTGDRLVVGIAVNTSTAQAAQVIGYLAGAGVAVASPRLALIIDALTFAVSAVLIRAGVRARPAALAPANRTHLLRETAQGFQLVFGDRALRAIALMVFSLTLFAIVPEGLAAAWAERSAAADGMSRGLAQGMIMAAGPIGFILGGLTIGRFVRPAARQRLIKPFAVLAPMALVPALAEPSAPVVAVMTLLSGFSVAGLMPTLNGMFVLALPHGFRARAFGVMQGGLQLTQGSAVLLTGLLAERFPLPAVVGLWSVGGVLLMLVVITRWPDPARSNATSTTPAFSVMSPPPTAGRIEA